MGMIVACAAYENGRGIADIDLAESGRFLASPDRFVWVGLHEPDANVLSTVQEQFGLHPPCRRGCAARALTAEARHFRPVLVHGSAYRTAPRWSGGIRRNAYLRRQGYVISVRHGLSSSYAKVRARCESEPELLRDGQDFVLYAIMFFVVDNYLEIVEVVEDEVEKFEDIAKRLMPLLPV